MRETGTYKILGGMQYFIPHPLPPANPPLTLQSDTMTRYGEASFALGQLNEMASRLPDATRFIRAYIIKEALLSSAIEGVHTTLIEVFTTPIAGKAPNKNTQLVVNYSHALEAALHMMREDNIPLVLRVILKAHEVLMTQGEGDRSTPGCFRKQSVRVGPLTPPIAPEIPDLMGDLEKYMNEPSSLPPLIKAGLVHVQFETIHPFLDGNGRIGRLLIVLMLVHHGLLDVPILYPSYYFKKHHAAYYEHLDRVRTHGDFEGWIEYYLTAIRDSATDAYRRALEIETLESRLRAVIEVDPPFRKMRETAAIVLSYLFTHPVGTISEIGHGLGKAYNTVKHILSLFEAQGWISFDQEKSSSYYFDLYLTALEKEYDA